MQTIGNNAGQARRLNVVMVAILAACALGAAPVEERDYSGDLPRIAPLEPAAAMKTFAIKPPYHMELVASEPLVTDPVAVAFDEYGRVYVAEMRGYSENREDDLCRVRLLEDTDGDGRLDRSTVFIDGLRWCTAVACWDGGVFIGAAPDIYYAKDTDGDGRADVKRTVLTGFGIENVQGLLNTFCWSLENKYVLATSSTGGEVRRTDQPDGEPLTLRRRDLGFDPRTGAIEAMSGGAQHGMSFDDWGRRYVCSNSDHLQMIMIEDRYLARNPFTAAPAAKMSIAADGPQAEVFRQSPVEAWRVIRTKLRVAGEVPGPVEGGGRAAGYFTGSTGSTIYRGDAWPREHKGLAIVADVGSNLIHRKRLEASGVGFIGHRIDEQSEFVTSSDLWFRPVQFANAPDGSLWVLDMYREVIEHPKSLPPVIKRHLDLTSGRDRGRLWRIVPEGYEYRPAPRIGDMKAAELVKLLEHPNAWHRETASRLLYQRQDKAAVEPLRQMVRKSEEPLGRMHAMYALDGLNALTAEDVLVGLRDEHPRVREHAVQLAEQFVTEAAVTQKLLSMAGDEDMRVRYQLALSLGEIRDESKLKPLVEIVQRDGEDKWVRIAVQTAVPQHAAQLIAMLEPGASTSGVSPMIAQLKQQIAAQQRIAAAPKIKQPQPAAAAPIVKPSDRKPIVDRYRKEMASLKGDAAKGRATFMSICIACHKAEGVGLEIGPNLAAFAATRGTDAVLLNVLDPNAEVNPQFIVHQVTLRDGRTVAGMVTSETASSVTLNMAGAEQTILRGEIESMKSTGVSLMPLGLEAAISPQSMADLIAYLLTLK